MTASFLGAQAIAHSSGLGALGGLALVSLAASIGFCVYVLLPKNQIKIDELGRYYLGAAVALGAQLVFWSWSLASNIS